MIRHIRELFHKDEIALLYYMNNLTKHLVPSSTHKQRISDYLVGVFDQLPSKSSVKKAIKASRTRFNRQIATGFSSTRLRRQAGSQGRSHTRPNTPGKTLDSQLII